MSKTSTINLGKAKGRRSLDKVEGFATSVGPEAHFTGSIGGAGHCIVHGRVEGDCDLQSTVVIGETGFWQGDIQAENILVAGRVEGTITARQKLEIISTARIQGSLTSPVIAIAEGAVHEGEIHMGQVQRFVDRRESD
jgi:cytoskeletal protein CcmA (bactofilin family)